MILLNRASISSASETEHEYGENEIVRIHNLPDSSSNMNTVKEAGLGATSNQQRSSLLLRRSESLKKRQNRLARIHSHDDILNLRNRSSLTEDVFGQNFCPIMEKIVDESPVRTPEKSPAGDFNFFERSHSIDLRKISETSFTVGDDANLLNKSFTYSTGTDGTDKIEFENSNYHSLQPLSFVGENQHTTNIKSVKYLNVGNGYRQSRSDKDQEDEEEDCSDASSRFSFENGNDLSGRTASLKYYAKADEAIPNIYVNDLYENDNFDDEMNYCDLDAEDEEDTEHLFVGNNSAASGYAEMYNLSDDELPNVESLKNDLQADTSSEASLTDAVSDKFEPYTLHDKSQTEDSMKCTELRSYGDIYNLSDDEIDEIEPSVEKEKTESFSKPKIVIDKAPAKSMFKVSKYEDLYNLSDDEESEKQNIEDDNFDMSENESNDTFEKENQLHEPYASLLSPDRTYMENSFVNSSPSNFKTPERSLLTSPKSQPVKYHGLSSTWDTDVKGSMSNLFYIDEIEEDKYLEESLVESEDYYLDEINGIPEDYDFSDNEADFSNIKSPLRRLTTKNLSSFRRTHSYSEKPIGMLKDSTPVKYKLEIKNKTVTFFDNNSVQRSFSDPYGTRPVISPRKMVDDTIIDNNGIFAPVTPTNSFTKPSPTFTQTSSLSPIQEMITSSDASPKLL